MMKINLSRFIYVLAVWLPAFLTGCHDSPSMPEKEVHRSLLVYMVASNNLQSYADMDLAEMYEAVKGGGLQGGRLLVYHVSKSRQPRLMEMTAADSLVVLKEYDSSVSSVSTERMGQVIDDFKKIARAPDYGMVLWSHGSGWLVDGIESKGDVAPKSFGDDYGMKMNVASLASVLEGRGFSFLYFDCCYMGAVEALYELRRCADYIVSSPSEIPVYGMDYRVNIPCFFAEEPDLVKAAQNTFRYYESFGDPEMRTCTMSVVRTSGLDGLAQAARDIFASAPWPGRLDEYPQTYMLGVCYHYDLLDYYRRISSSESLIDALKGSLAETVVCEYATQYLWNRISIDEHCGLSSYVVDSEMKIDTKGYSSLSWYKDVVSHMTERN